MTRTFFFFVHRVRWHDRAVSCLWR